METLKSELQIKSELKAANLPKDKIEMNGQILFFRGQGMFIGRIVEIRDKAVKVDYCVEGVSVYSRPGVVIFDSTTWIPKSSIINDEIGGLTVKKWFERSVLKGFRIKKYMMKDGKQIFI